LHNVAIVLGLMAVFVIGSTALGASKLQAHDGGTWWHAFLGGLGPVAFLAAPVAVILIIGAKGRGDKMPAHLWADQGTPALSGRTFRLTTTYRLAMSGFFALMVLFAPFFAYEALHDGPGPTIFVAIWLAMMGAGLRFWLRKSPEALTLTPDDVLHVDGPRWGRQHWDIPVDSLQEIRWPTMGQYVEVRHIGGRMWVPKQVEDLDRLVVELRRRNPNIHFDGHWPPRRYGFT
jgi:hypothetical protein